jgi:hypothetical protein
MEAHPMKRCLRLNQLFLVTVVTSALAAGSVGASHPDFIRSYRFIPSRSTLIVNGASTGLLEPTFHARGAFDLVTGYEEGVTCAAIGCPPPPHVPFAKFTDVDAWLIPDSPLAYVLNLDRTLNLSGLDGTFGNTGPDNLYFRGVDGKGRPFHLKATARGPLLRMVGESGPGCCDIDHYLFNAVAYRWPHPDFNLDGVVNAADYVAWRNELNEAAADVGATGSAFDPGDYAMWRAQFGAVTDFNVFTEAELSLGVVPEPSAIALVFVAALMRPARVRRRH